MRRGARRQFDPLVENGRLVAEAVSDLQLDQFRGRVAVQQTDDAQRGEQHPHHTEHQAGHRQPLAGLGISGPGTPAQLHQAADAEGDRGRPQAAEDAGDQEVTARPLVRGRAGCGLNGPGYARPGNSAPRAPGGACGGTGIRPVTSGGTASPGGAHGSLGSGLSEPSGPCETSGAFELSEPFEASAPSAVIVPPPCPRPGSIESTRDSNAPRPQPSAQGRFYSSSFPPLH